MIRPPRQRSKDGGLQRRTDFESCARPNHQLQEQKNCYKRTRWPKNSDLAVIPVPFLWPQAEASRTDRALTKITKVADGCGRRIARLASAGARSFNGSMRQAANCEHTAPSGRVCKPPHSRTSRSGDTAQPSCPTGWDDEVTVHVSGPLHTAHGSCKHTCISYLEVVEDRLGKSCRCTSLVGHKH